MLGRDETDCLDAGGRDLLRLLTPVVKLTTGRQAMVVLPEIVESFGGAGYVEDTGIPVLLRDAQVFSIWEGTTNVLALDALRALQSGNAHGALQIEVETLASAVRDTRLLACVKAAQAALSHSQSWLLQATGDAQEAGARRFAMTLGRAFALLLLCRHAQWSLDHEKDQRPLAAAARFAQNGVDLIAGEDVAASKALANDSEPSISECRNCREYSKTGSETVRLLSPYGIHVFLFHDIHDIHGFLTAFSARPAGRA